MIRRLTSWRLLLFLILLTSSASVCADVVRVVIDGTINPVSAEYVERGLARAADQHAQAVLIEDRKSVV